jgi:hypothetical protein
MAGTRMKVDGIGTVNMSIIMLDGFFFHGPKTLTRALRHFLTRRLKAFTQREGSLSYDRSTAVHLRGYGGDAVSTPLTCWLLNSHTCHVISPVHSTMSSDAVQTLEYLQLDHCAAGMLNYNSRQ